MAKAGPLVYVILILGTALSVFPLYFMFVVATRTNDTIGGLPPVLTPGGNLGDNIDRLLANEDAHFLRGLVNSVLVSASVTIAVVFFSTLAGFEDSPSAAHTDPPLTTVHQPVEAMGRGDGPAAAAADQRRRAGRAAGDPADPPGGPRIRLNRTAPPDGLRSALRALRAG